MSLPGDENPTPQRSPSKRREDGRPVWEERPHAPLPQPSPATPGMAVAALALSVAGLVLFPIVGSIGGLALGYRARDEIVRAGGDGRRGPAAAGIVVGWIGLAVYGGLILFALSLKTL